MESPAHCHTCKPAASPLCLKVAELPRCRPDLERCCLCPDPSSVVSSVLSCFQATNYVCPGCHASIYDSCAHTELSERRCPACGDVEKDAEPLRCYLARPGRRARQIVPARLSTRWRNLGRVPVARTPKFSMWQTRVHSRSALPLFFATKLPKLTGGLGSACRKERGPWNPSGGRD
ncbi:unnamed protein product [Symbiodinium sp. CCMP2592]|nr:unnamed protein product [Symbiodinium sp. CCMP2592]